MLPFSRAARRNVQGPNSRKGESVRIVRTDEDIKKDIVDVLYGEDPDGSARRHAYEVGFRASGVKEVDNGPAVQCEFPADPVEVPEEI